MDFGKLVGFGFTAGMALYFLYSFVFPQETDFWLVKNGFPILMIEGFFGTVFTLMIAQALGKEMAGASYGGSNPVMMLVGVIAFAGVFIYIINPGLLGYLAFTVIVKIIQIRQTQDMGFEINLVAFSIFFFIVGSFFGLFSAPPVSWIFGAQNQAYTHFFRASGTGSGGAIVENPMVLAMWGFAYYIGMAAINLVAPKIFDRGQQLPRA